MEEEKVLALKQECAEMKAKMAETAETINKLKKLLSSYQSAHLRWQLRYERADRQLAEAFKVTKLPANKSGKKQKKLTFTKKQILAIANSLGVDLDATD